MKNFKDLDNSALKEGKKRKLMSGEIAKDEVIPDALTAYRVEVHNVILDTVTESMNSRFLANGKLYADFFCLDPRNFPDIISNGLKPGVLDELSVHLVKFEENATSENLRIELKNLVLHWDKLKISVLELDDYKIREDDNDEESLGNQDNETAVLSKTCSACKNCAICGFKILSRYNLLTTAYNLIGLEYKFHLALSLTQVACERFFSTLKIIKNRLRNSLSSDNLNSFMLMAVEKMNLDSHEVIDKVAESSELLMKSLTV